MKSINLKSFFLFFFFSSNLFSQTIVVVDVQNLIDNNQSFIKAKKIMELSQEKYLDNFKDTEAELKKMLKDIETSKIILNENEINNQIDKYNQKLNDFSILIDEFNIHYQNQIIIMREKLLKEIILLLENYAIKKDIDLILDTTSYLIASNSIDITDEIKQQLNNLKIILEHKNFEKN